jgi:protein arginine N-methyltransferase 1
LIFDRAMYSLSGYCSMIADRVRINAYTEALRRAVKPGAVVLDIGTGTGICALLACRLGARRVYAVEPDAVIQVARETASANGYADRVEFIQNVSTQITLPERADVIVSDLRGVLPPFHQHLPSLADARRRHLAPAGLLIPQRDTLHAVVVEAPEIYARHVAPWGNNDFGFTLGPASRLLSNTWRKVRVVPEQLLTEPRQWAELDYTALESPNVHGSLTWAVGRAGTGHGVACWFDATLVPGVTFSNAPGEPELIYGHAFFPWPVPVTLSSGDTVSVELHADLLGEDYVWRWGTRVVGATGRAIAEFHQSTFFGTPLAAANLRKCAADFVPKPSEDARIDLFILDLLCGGAPLGEIARRLAAQFPGRFPGWAEALTRVGELSVRYSQ